MKRASVLQGALSRLKPSQLQIRLYSEQSGSSNAVSKDEPSRPYSEEIVLKINQENKTIETPAGALPISPLMDPAWQEAITRPRKPKLRANTIPKTRFRRQLERNPYAQALATKSRNCAITNSTLPRFFLQDFNLLEHPETKTPYWVPTSLASNQRQPGASTAAPPTQGDDAPTPDEVNPSNAGHPVKAKKPAGPSSYILGRQDLFKALMSSKSAFWRSYKRLARKTTSTHLNAALNAAEWRPDMDAFVLELLRRRIVEDLLYLSKKCEELGRQYLVKLTNLDGIKNSRTGACILRINTADAAAEDVSGGSPSVADNTVEGADGIPVHDLTRLLGSTHTNHLRSESTLFREGTLFLLDRKQSFDVQLKLWKLHGYLLQDDEPPQATKV